MSKNNSRNEFLGRGYYIALLCAAAIGLCGFLYYRSTNNEPLRLSDPDTTVSATVSGGDVQAIAGRPETLTPDGSAATTAPAPSEKPALKTAAPVEGQTVAVFSVDALSYNQTTRDWRTHDGVDIAAEAGTKVCAAADGEVYTVYEDDALGTTVVIRHAGGYVTKYASLAEAVTVAPGEQVKMGQPIGAVGCSALLENSIGDHVHFSVTCNDEPVDPAVFLKQG
jgi:murein DD-endopeptidase MepM/ murein hydrolase activator NlpD